MPTSGSDLRNSGTGSRALWLALRRLLRPLVRLLLDLQVTYPQLASLLKEVFVEVGDQEFRLRGKGQTDSRVSLLTGIHRKDVRRLREAGRAPVEESAVASLGEQVYRAWIRQPEWLNAAGRPLALPRNAEPGQPSFEALVESVSRDIRPRSVLDEWMRLGVVELDPRNNIVLDPSSFVSNQAFEEKIELLGRNLEAHIASAARGLGPDPGGFVEGNVRCTQLTEASVWVLRQLCADAAGELLRTVQRRAEELQARDWRQPGAVSRFDFGIYVHDEVDE